MINVCLERLEPYAILAEWLEQNTMALSCSPGERQPHMGRLKASTPILNT